MVCTTCHACGGEYHWDWSNAFYKFGFNDGDGQVETWRVEEVLTAAGYTVIAEEWGLHNTVIISIVKDGVELIPYDNPDYEFGYDDPYRYFPEDLIKLLDDQLPSTG